jgi:hypothetical protein
VLRRASKIWIVLVTLFVIIAMPVAAPAQETVKEGRGVRTANTPGKLLDEVDPLAIGLGKFKVWGIKGGYVSAGVGMRNLGRGDIVLKGIPKGATVQGAYLYWNIIDITAKANHARGLLNGTVVRGTLIGTTDSPCWWKDPGDNAKSRSYRANVTALVTKNGTYKLREFASGITTGADPWVAPVKYPLLEGATLVVVYTKSGYPYTRIFLYDGAAEVGAVASARTTTITNVPPWTSFLAYTTFIGGDGQSAPEPRSQVNGRGINQADWDGTDPIIKPGNYSLGNLWDTENASTADTAKRSISVGWFMPPSSTSVQIRVIGGSDCLVHVAQVLSVSNGSIDSDKDGLPNAWEGNGYDHLSDGTIDVNLPALGANPFHKDLYLEIDWMEMPGDNHRPNDTVVNRMVNTFKKGNVGNPDGVTGVDLHVDRSNSIPHTQDVSANCGTLWTAAEALKAANMPAARYKTHHYQLHVHDLCPGLGSTSGMAQGIPADDSIVSLGSWPSQGTTDARTGTAIHELGHTINLRHGFPTGVSLAGDGGSDDPYTPNHLSVMSYLYQVNGLIRNGAYGYWDFQRWDLPALNENCLNENVGVGSLSALDLYGLRWYHWTGSSNVLRQDLTPGAANGPVDWNASGFIVTCAAASINNDSDLEILQATKKEWDKLVYDGGPIGLGVEYGIGPNYEQVPVFEIDPLTYYELTYEDYLEMQLSLSSEITPVEGE